MNLNDRGLLMRLRTDYQQRVKRLTQRLAAQQQTCGALAADSAEMKERLQPQIGRPLSPQQQQGLLDLGLQEQGSSSGTR